MAERMDPNPWLLAEESTVDDFFAQYRQEMASWRRASAPNALWGAVANRDPHARAVIANRLLDDGADARTSEDSTVNLLSTCCSGIESSMSLTMLLCCSACWTVVRIST